MFDLNFDPKTFLKNAAGSAERGLDRIFAVPQRGLVSSDGHRAHIVPANPLPEKDLSLDLQALLPQGRGPDQASFRRVTEFPKGFEICEVDAKTLRKAAQDAHKRIRARGSEFFRGFVRWDRAGLSLFGVEAQEQKTGRGKKKTVLVRSDEPIALIPVESSLATSIGINPLFLYEALVHARGAVRVHHLDPRDPVYLQRDDGCKAVIMPVIL